MDFFWSIRFNGARPAPARETNEEAGVFDSLDRFPAWAQTKLLPKGAAARVDNCAPAPPEPEVQRSGIFGWSMRENDRVNRETIERFG
jgi:hypothetical protein